MNKFNEWYKSLVNISLSLFVTSQNFLRFVYFEV